MSGTADTVFKMDGSSQMNELIRAIVGDHGKLTVPMGEVRDGDDLFQAGLTSLNTVSVMLAIEDRLDLEFPEESLRRATFQSINSLHSVIRGLGVQTT
jgi:acyl carrier protein